MKDSVRRRWVPGRQTLSPQPARSGPQVPATDEENVEDEETRAADVTYDPCYGRFELLRNRRSRNEN